MGGLQTQMYLSNVEDAKIKNTREERNDLCLRLKFPY